VDFYKGEFDNWETHMTSAQICADVILKFKNEKFPIGIT